MIIGLIFPIFLNSIIFLININKKLSQKKGFGIINLLPLLISALVILVIYFFHNTSFNFAREYFFWMNLLYYASYVFNIYIDDIKTDGNKIVFNNEEKAYFILLASFIMITAAQIHLVICL